MSYADAVTRISQIERALLPSSSKPATVATTSFADALTEAQAGTSSQPTASAASLEPGLPGTSPAAQQLTSSQQLFAQRLAADTGLDPNVISAWLLSEESGGAAQTRQAAANNDWLNIGYTDGGTYGSTDPAWSEPIAAADATAGWLKGQGTIAGYGTASSGIQAILNTAGQPAQTQIAAIQQSGWASSGYPDLPTVYRQLAG
jgi:hypothetical protein